MQAKKSGIPLSQLSPNLARKKAHKAERKNSRPVEPKPSPEPRIERAVPYGVSAAPAQAIATLSNQSANVTSATPMFPANEANETDSIPDLVTDSDNERRPDDCRILITDSGSDSSPSTFKNSTPPASPPTASNRQMLHNLNVSPTAYERLSQIPFAPSEMHIADIIHSQMQADLYHFSRPGPLIARRQRPKKPRIRNERR